MGIYTRLKALIPKQSCILCGEHATSCICCQCESGFTNQQPRCRSCANPITSQLDFCGECLTHAPAFNRAYTLYDYQGAMTDLIKRFKYDKQLCIGDYFAHQLYQLYRSIINAGNQYDAIIPMPLSKQRIQQRGYNQALELLRLIKKKELVIIDLHNTQRIKATQPLSSLKLEQRKQEIKGAFAAKSMPYQRILLVDDIMTSGSSLNELTKTITRSNPTIRCDVMTLARTYSNH